MPVLVHLAQLIHGPLTLEGDLPPEEVDWGGPEDLVSVRAPLRYRVEVRREGATLALKGELSLEVDCQCARCLRAFRLRISLAPWNNHLPLDLPSPDAELTEVVDLTPLLREDTVLALPRHPVCDPECAGLLPATPPSNSSGRAGPSPWAALDQLEL